MKRCYCQSVGLRLIIIIIPQNKGYLLLKKCIFCPDKINFRPCHLDLVPLMYAALLKNYLKFYRSALQLGTTIEFHKNVGIFIMVDVNHHCI